MGIILLLLIGFCLVCIIIASVCQDTGVREFNGKRYQMKSVGTDIDKAFKDSINCTLGKISRQEYIRRSNSGVYAINAWVEVGKDTFSWKEDPINKDIFLKYAHDTDILPKYLQTDTLKTVRDYRKQ